MRMAGLPQTSLIATSSRGRTVLLLMTINPDGPSITPQGPGVQFMNSDRLFFLQLYRWFPSKGRHEHSEIDISLQPAESGVVAYRTTEPLRGFARQVDRCR
jgi:hypothetical protein